MKKIFALLLLTCLNIGFAFADDNLSIWNLKKMGVSANAPITKSELSKAEKILLDVHKQTAEKIKQGHGPFFALIMNDEGEIIAGEANSVVIDSCSCYHAEINTIISAQKKLGTYDLTPYNLTLYVNAEPCAMCTGAIAWSGIKKVFYSVPTAKVETITGFDEGHKPSWLYAFKKRGIKVYGNIVPEAGEAVLQQYVNVGNEIYKPQR